jgi:hypothetical protein
VTPPATDHDVARERVSEASDRDRLDEDSGGGDGESESPALSGHDVERR